MSDTFYRITQDVMDPARTAALMATLGRSDKVQAGSPLPPFAHHLYFWVTLRPNELGADGNPKIGGLIPDLGLPRRMWAGGSLSFRAPVILGEPAERRAHAIRADRRQGRSGAMAVVTIRNEIWQNDKLCIVEHEDLIYRETPALDAIPAARHKAPTDEDLSDSRCFDSTALFRYSALTMNGHRVHYDETYASNVDGYDGLVVQGQLLTQMLLLQAAEFQPISTFSFRVNTPLMVGESAAFCQKGEKAWVRAQDGRQCLSASINTENPASAEAG